MKGKLEAKPTRKVGIPLQVDHSGRVLLPRHTVVGSAGCTGERLIGIEEPDGSFRLKTRSQVLGELQVCLVRRSSRKTEA